MSESRACVTCRRTVSACTSAGAITRALTITICPWSVLLPIVLKAKPQGLLFEAANPRHAHEWAVFEKVKIPDYKVLIPGLLATTTNYIEHPQLIAERIERFAQSSAANGSWRAPIAALGPLPDLVQSSRISRI